MVKEARAKAEQPRIDRGTTETRAKLATEKPRQYLVDTEDDPVFERACNEIERVYLAITRAVLPRLSSLSRIDGGRGGEIPEGAAMAHALRWKPWADRLSMLRDGRGIPALALTIDALVDERNFRELDEAYSMRRGTAQKVVRESVRYYCVVAEWKRLEEYKDFDIIAPMYNSPQKS